MPKVRALVIGRFVTAAAHNVAPLPQATGSQVDGCPDRVARALGSTDQFHAHPVMFVRVHVVQQNRRMVHAVDDHIDFPVVE